MENCQISQFLHIRKVQNCKYANFCNTCTCTPKEVKHELSTNKEKTSVILTWHVYPSLLGFFVQACIGTICCLHGETSLRGGQGGQNLLLPVPFFSQLPPSSVLLLFPVNKETPNLTHPCHLDVQSFHFLFLFGFNLAPFTHIF